MMTHTLRRIQQRGATLIVVALGMGMALAAMMALDIGNLVWQKRELQKIADLAALAGARQPLTEACTDGPTANAFQVAEANGLVQGKDQFDVRTGKWQPLADSAQETFFTPLADAQVSEMNACHVTVKRVVNYFFIWPASAGSGRELVAKATAAAVSPRVARLSIRTQLAKLDSQDSVILNGLIGGLLGGKLDLNVMSWQGLADLDVSLLGYLQALAIDLQLEAGGYEQLLQTELGVGELVSALITAVEQNDATANVALQALRAIEAKAQVSPLRLRLADLLQVQSGLPQEALRTDLNVLQLVQALVQVGNSNNSVAGAIAIPLPGIVGVNAYVQVIEPPMLSAIGDPELARQQPRGPHEIFVRSAQTRVLLSVELPAAGLATSVLNGLTTLLSPVLSLVNLLLGGGVGLLDIEVLPAPLRIDLGLDVGSGYAYLTDYSCSASDKSVEIQTRTSVADLRLGKWGNTPEQARDNAFASKGLVPIEPIPVVRLDCLGCHGKSRIPQYFGGLGLKLDVPVLETKPALKTLSPVAGLDEPIQWGAASSASGVVKSLGPTLLALNALPSLPADSRASPAGVGGLLNALSGVLGSVLGVVNSLVVSVLSPLLDPIIDSLLKLLGIQLAGTEYGAQLNCGGAAELVY